jgi:cbb3-type cytochrome oxidase maturation protein
VIYLLISVSLLVAVGFLTAFLWAVRSGQYEDKFTPSIRMLIDDKHKIGLNVKKNDKPGQEN